MEDMKNNQTVWWEIALSVIGSPLLVGFFFLVGGNFVYELTSSPSLEFRSLCARF